MAKTKNVRMDDDIRRLITAHMILLNCNESVAVRDLLMAGAKAPRLRPVIAQLCSREQLLKFAALLLQWQQLFQSIRARLTLALPDPEDKELCELVAKWRKLADELEPQARVLSAMANALAKTLMGMDHTMCVNLGIAKKEVVQRIKKLKGQLATTLTSEEQAECVSMLQMLETILTALDIFSV